MHASCAHEFLRLYQNRGLQAGKRKIKVSTVQQWPGQGESARITARRQRCQQGATRVRQPHQLGRLVKSLSRGVINGFSQQGVVTHRLDLHELRMSTGNQQGHKRKFRRIHAQERRQQMPFQVVHAQHRLVERCAQRASHTRSDQQGTGQARPAGVRHQVDLRQCGTARVQHLLHQWTDTLDMVPARQFRDHAAERLVQGNLAMQRMRQQTWWSKRHVAARYTYDRNTGFIT